MKLINIGYGNMVAAGRVVAIVSPESAPIKRMIQDARDGGSLIDATYGRRTRAVIIADSGHIILSAIQPETVSNRISGCFHGGNRGGRRIVSGKLFVISGPSGAGKGSIVEKLLGRNANIYFSVSATTRSKRPNETNGKEYWFVSREEFLDRIEQGRMLEWAEYEGQYYGTPADPVDEKLRAGYDVLLDIESRGMHSVKSLRPDAVTMFVYPPSFAELERRLRNRKTETEEKILGRLAKGRQECRKAEEYDYIIINDDLEVAAAEAAAIMTAEKCRTSERLHILKEDKTL